jgi:hypothetical protein
MELSVILLNILIILFVLMSDEFASLQTFMTVYRLPFESWKTEKIFLEDIFRRYNQIWA